MGDGQRFILPNVTVDPVVERAEGPDIVELCTLVRATGAGKCGGEVGWSEVRCCEARWDRMGHGWRVGEVAGWWSGGTVRWWSVEF